MTLFGAQSKEAKAASANRESQSLHGRLKYAKQINALKKTAVIMAKKMSFSKGKVLCKYLFMEQLYLSLGLDFV